MADGVSWFQGSVIQVDTLVMVNKADQVSSVISKMERTFGELQRAVSGTGVYWTGEAAECYRRMFYDEREEILRILNRLKEYPSNLKEIASGYDRTEKELLGQNQRLESHYI